MKFNSAWIIEWEWIGDHRKVDPNILHILPPQLGSKRVSEYLIALSLNSQLFMPSERLAIFRGRHEHGLLACTQEGPRIFCGSNPFLAAHRVKDLHVWIDPDTGDEIVEWTNLPGFRYNRDTGRMEEMGQPIPRRVRISAHGIRKPQD